jgi:multicomponent K+:H+ antiporter subunit D
VAIWTVMLVSSLVAIYGLSRAGSTVFWKAHELGPDPAPQAASHESQRPLPAKVEPDEDVQDLADSASPALALTATGALIAGMVALAVFGGPVMDYARETARQLVDPAPYVDAVLLRQEGTR